ncbi:MAG: hypothetical protein M0Q38_13490 [Bacteroidales bacterium]|jgi:hypothetical protein|nr:hypothetical protein [Bacteroidales bacterium]
MRKAGLIFTLTLLFLQINAQINIEKSLTESTWIGHLTNSGYKYYSMDVVNNQCRIYNLDFSLWKTIPLSVPTGYTLYDIEFVSENLFTTDGLVSLAYMYYQYNTTLQYYTYEVRIIREDGNIMVTAPGAAYMYVLSTGDNGTKFLVYLYDYSTYPYFLGTTIYSLPGTLVGEKLIAGKDKSERFAYPNPSRSFVTIPIPDNSSKTSVVLKIFDITGLEIRNIELNKTRLNLR